METRFSSEELYFLVREKPECHPSASALLLAVSFALINHAITVLKAFRSPLRKVPGSWYAPLTTLHLRHGFATGKIWKMVEKGHKAYGPIFRLSPRQIWVSEKEAMKTILQTVYLPKVNMYAEISRDLLSPGLFGEVRPGPHKNLKKFLSPAFSVSYVDNLDQFFSLCIGSLVKKYRNQTCSASSPQAPKTTEIDLMNGLHCVALDVMGECSFGRGFGQTNPTKDEYLNVEERVWKRIPDSIFSGMTQRYQGIQAIADSRTTEKTASRPDLLQHLIEDGTRPDNLQIMTSRDIIDQIAKTILAGSETTSGTITCLFLELARSPDKKKKLLQSLPALSPDDPVIDSKAIRTDDQYKYLNACIKENLRMHPIASEMGRKTGKEWCHLAGYDIPPGTVVSASYRNLHRSEEFWPEPLKFWPERWLENEEEREGAPKPDFARAEIRMAAANVLSRFDVEEIPRQVIDYRQYITM
ncbi:cytochrome P450 [Aspergillus affinis]|uniref:cytochrome P450 n=1 Tax=Aspergillus affinis TaxID=1070780 RepID=UPI0022FE2164|nr:cytochrome P450 [Aspergillus affinis]KAI9042747.1 cytochrome P450 [Aspergillus affinis]